MAVKLVRGKSIAEEQANKKQSSTEKKLVRGISIEEGNRITVPLTVGDQNLGDISYNAYYAIENNSLDTYVPLNAKEQNTLNKYKNYINTTKTYKLGVHDAPVKLLPNLREAPSGSKFNINNTVKSEPIDTNIDTKNKSPDKDINMKTQDSYPVKRPALQDSALAKQIAAPTYVKPVSKTPVIPKQTSIGEAVNLIEPPPKQKQPNSKGEALLHSVGYLGEKTLAGATGAVENLTNYAIAIPTYVLGGITSLGGLANNPVSDKLNDIAEKQLAKKDLSTYWSENIEKRYAVPDVIRKYGGKRRGNTSVHCH